MSEIGSRICSYARNCLVAEIFDYLSFSLCRCIYTSQQSNSKWAHSIFQKLITKWRTSLVITDLPLERLGSDRFWQLAKLFNRIMTNYSLWAHLWKSIVSGIKYWRTRTYSISALQHMLWILRVSWSRACAQLWLKNSEIWKKQ